MDLEKFTKVMDLVELTDLIDSGECTDEYLEYVYERIEGFTEEEVHHFVKAHCKSKQANN